MMPSKQAIAAEQSSNKPQPHQLLEAAGGAAHTRDLATVQLQGTCAVLILIVTSAA